MSKTLRVGLLLDDSLDRPDGVQQYVLTLGEWLRKQGHEVHYLVGETRRDDIENVHSLSRNLNARFNKNRLSIPLSTKPAQITALLKKLDLDVLHVQLPCHPLMGSRIIARVDPKTAVVGTFHIMPSGLLSKTGTKLLGSLQKKTLARFDSVFAVSKPAQEFASKSYHTATDAVIPNMVDTHAFQVSEVSKPTEAKRIVFLGRLVERKGCLYLLKALVALPKDTLPPFSVQIGGAGPLEASLKRYVIDNGLQDSVHFQGFIDEADRPRFLAEADIAVFPATGGESFGIVLIEAMAAGAGVVIGGNNPGYASVLAGEPQTTFDPHKTSDFAELLAKLLVNEAEARSIHKFQQERVKQFDVEVVGSQVVSTYEEAIAKRRSSLDNEVKPLGTHEYTKS